MAIDFSGMNQSIAHSVSLAETVNSKYEELQRIKAQEYQERIDREEKMVAGAEANIAQNELLEKQVEILLKQNELLSDNYIKLKEMFDSQVEANKEAREELKVSRRYNIAMMIISIIAMLAAIAGPIVTAIVSAN